VNGGRILAVTAWAVVTGLAVAQAVPKASASDVYQRWIEETSLISLRRTSVRSS